MANTRFAIDYDPAAKLGASVPDTGGDNTGSNMRKASSGGETGSASAGNAGGKVNSPNTGLMTDVSTVATDLHENSVIAGGFFFIGLVLMALAIRSIKRNRNAHKRNFRVNSRRDFLNTRALCCLAVLAFVGGGIDFAFLHIGAKASDEVISSSAVVNAVLTEKTDAYSLYCGTDTITINSAAPNGYVLRMSMGNNEGTLVGSSSNIESTENWAALGNNTWGYRIGSGTTFNPLPEGANYGAGGIQAAEGTEIPEVASIISDSTSPVAAETEIPVTFCAKITGANKDKFVADLNYGIEYLEADQSYKPLSEYYSSVDGTNARLKNRRGLDLEMEDSDFDGLTDLEEITLGTDPLSADSDGDGLLDYTEAKNLLSTSLSATNWQSEVAGNKDGDNIHTFSGSEADYGFDYEIQGTGDLASTLIGVYQEADSEDDSKIYHIIPNNEDTSVTITAKNSSNYVYELEENEESEDSQLNATGEGGESKEITGSGFFTILQEEASLQDQNLTRDSVALISVFYIGLGAAEYLKNLIVAPVDTLCNTLLLFAETINDPNWQSSVLIVLNGLHQSIASALAQMSTSSTSSDSATANKLKQSGVAGVSADLSKVTFKLKKGNKTKTANISLSSLSSTKKKKVRDYVNRLSKRF